MASAARSPKLPSTPSAVSRTPSTSVSTTSQKDSKQLKPINILSGPFAQVYTHIHPILLLSLPYFGFAGLVRDPVETLITWAPLVAALQGVYCVGCLPSSTGSGTTGGSGSTGTPGKRKAKGKAAAGGFGREVGGRVVQTFLSYLLTLTLATPLLAILLFLFGAAVTNHHAPTALLALHLALLTSPPLFYSHGLDTATWRRLLSLQQPVDEVYGAAVGACVGAWLGAVPIPLDWDRDWQRWPVTVVGGAYAGVVVGKLVGGFLLKSFTGKIS